VLILLSLFFFPVQAKREKVYRIAGVSTGEKGKPAPAEVLSFVEGGVRVTIRYLDPRAAEAALASVVDGAAGLFHERTESSRGHLAFALQLENEARDLLLFEPGQGRLVTDRADAEFPLDYTRLYQILARRPGGGPPLEELERAVFTRAVTVKPGGSVRKLLVFEGPRNGRFKKFEVRIGVLHLADRDIDARFPFRRFEVKP
jgi:hypothetical protein